MKRIAILALAALALALVGCNNPTSNDDTSNTDQTDDTTNDSNDDSTNDGSGSTTDYTILFEVTGTDGAAAGNIYYKAGPDIGGTDKRVDSPQIPWSKEVTLTDPPKDTELTLAAPKTTHTGTLTAELTVTQHGTKTNSVDLKNAMARVDTTLGQYLSN
jgi:uncharacterized lipoprotein NlpE involved in copper resistance